MTDTLDMIEPKTPQAPAKVTDIRDVSERQPPLEDRGIMDPGQTYTRHLAMASSGAAASLPGQGLGFRARCVIVDNFSNQYVYFPEGETWCAPYLIGYRILLQPTTISRCDTNSTARGTITQIAALTGELCVVTWCEKVVLSTPVMLTTGTRAQP